MDPDCKVNIVNTLEETFRVGRRHLDHCQHNNNHPMDNIYLAIYTIEIKNQYHTYAFFFPPFFPLDKRLFFPTAMVLQPAKFQQHQILSTFYVTLYTIKWMNRVRK